MREGWKLTGVGYYERHVETEDGGDFMAVMRMHDGTYSIWPLGPVINLRNGVPCDSDDDAMAFAETLSVFLES